MYYLTLFNRRVWSYSFFVLLDVYGYNAMKAAQLRSLHDLFRIYLRILLNKNLLCNLA